MIKGSLIVTAVLIFIHWLCMAVIWKDVEVSEHQWQDNHIKAQRYIFMDPVPDKVIIGSSLSCRLNMDSIPGIYNFALSGQGIRDALFVIREMHQYPKLILVEMNLALRETNQTFITAISSSSYLNHVRKYFSNLREGKQPLGQLKDPATSIVNFLLQYFRKNVIPTPKPLLQKRSSSSLLNGWIEGECISLSKIPSKSAIDTAFHILQQQIHELEMKGSRIIFFEMPIDDRLRDLATPTAIREAFYRTFSKERYLYIQQPAGYQTTDGQHLDQAEGTRYSVYLRDQLLGRKQL